MRNKLIALFLTIPFIVFLTTSVFADEKVKGFTIEELSGNSKEVLEGMEHKDMLSMSGDEISKDIVSSTDNVFSALHMALENREDTMLGNVLKDYAPFQLDTEAYYSVQDLELKNKNDFGIINLEYASLFHDLGEAKGSIDLSGFSRSATKIFNESYGDLANNIYLQTYSIPKNFSVDNILSRGQDNINQLYGEALNSDIFQSVQKRISIGDVFEQAKAGVRPYSLSSVGSLKSLISNYSQDIDKEVMDKFEKSCLTFEIDAEEAKRENEFNAYVHKATGQTADEIENRQNYIKNKKKSYSDSKSVDASANKYLEVAYGSLMGKGGKKEYSKDALLDKKWQAVQKVAASRRGLESPTFPKNEKELAEYDLAATLLEAEGYDEARYGKIGGLNASMNSMANKLTFWDASDDKYTEACKKALQISKIVEYNRNSKKSLDSCKKLYEESK